MIIGALDPDEFFDRVIEGRRPAPGPIQDWRRWWREEADADPDLAATGFVRSVGEVTIAGFSRSQVRTALRRGRWVRAGRGLVAPVDVARDLPDEGASFALARRRHALHAAGATRVRPSEVIAARSAAILHGLPTSRVPDIPELLARDVGAGRRRSAHLYTARVRSDEIESWFGCPVTTPARTLVDLGRHDRFDAIMAVDAALREELVTERDITRALEVARGWPGVRRARAVLALGDGRSESPLESITRLRIHDEGLPMPELQVWIGPYRVDFYWARWGFVLEADGRVKYTSEERWKEKKREQALRRRGVARIERVTLSDVLSGWPATAALLRTILI